MKILIDIGHPAHVHYFRNFIKIMQNKKHKILVVARDKEVSQELLKEYEIEYVTRGKGGNSFVTKLLYLIKTNFILFFKAFSFKPDIFLSFSSPYAAQVSWVLRKPHIGFTDTEHAKLGNYAFMPFTSTIITPKAFLTQLGKKHIKFNGFMEQCYLSPNYFIPKKDVSKLLNIKKDEAYILLRFVSWGAVHDAGHSGLSDSAKIEIIDRLSKNYRVFISAEAELPEKFMPYKLTISPDKMHDILANTALFIGEGATMASECAMLGTPAIYVNSLNAGTLIAQERNGSIFGFRNSEGVLKKAIEILETPQLKEKFQEKRKELLKNSIDVTMFTVWLVENYPKSIHLINNSSDYQDRFKYKELSDD
jgi:predicted glycosyltransferase